MSSRKGRVRYTTWAPEDPQELHEVLNVAVSKNIPKAQAQQQETKINDRRRAISLHTNHGKLPAARVGLSQQKPWRKCHGYGKPTRKRNTLHPKLWL